MFPRNQLFRDIWAGDGKRLRLRVNDSNASTHEIFGHRWETAEVGLAWAKVDDSLFDLAGAEVGLEMWGGHPLTSEKRFTINGHHSYAIPGTGTLSGNCEYTFPVVGIRPGDLVRGSNALQFACSKGDGFWGHFIVDNLRLRLIYKDGAGPTEAREALESLQLAHEFQRSGSNDHRVEFALSGPDGVLSQIAAVDYFMLCSDFDTRGGAQALSHGWRGYTRDTAFEGHLARLTEPPFGLEWSDEHLPRQAGPVVVTALVTLKSGFSFACGQCTVDVPGGLGSSCIFGAQQLPSPFWSRDGRERSATIVIPHDVVSAASRAELHVRFWDGADFDGVPPVSFNDNPLPLVDGSAPHDLVYTRSELDVNLLSAGANQFAICSHTEHHGLEVLLPGPAVQLWFE